MSEVDAYLAKLPAEARRRAEELRAAIREAAPEAEETMSYRMPAFKLDGILVWYGAHVKHIGFYPRVSAMTAFREELGAYQTSKGAVRFPIGQAIPAGMVKRMVRFRVNENRERAKRASG